MSKLHTQGTSLKALQEQLLKEKPYLRKGNGEVMQTVNGSQERLTLIAVM